MRSLSWTALLLLAGCATTAAPTPMAVRSAEPARDLRAECRPNPYLPRAREQYERLEYDRAAASLQRAMQHGMACQAELAEIYRLKAFIDAING